VDTSNYQHSTSLNWSAVRNTGVRFAFLKATEGSTYSDPYFAGDWAASGRVGIYHGAYHFARPSLGSAASQARYFVSRLPNQRVAGTLPPVLDLEAAGKLTPSQLITWTHNWLKTVQSLTGRTPIIYVSPAFWQYHMANNTGFHYYPLWIANYGVSRPTVPGGWPTWSFWQSTSSGRISGISGNVDRDVFNGPLSGLQKFALAYAPPAPVATSLSLTPSNAAPTTGQTVTFSGKLLDPAGKAVAGRTISLTTARPGSTTWSQVATATTTSTGFYSVKLPVTAAAGYRASFAGDSSYTRSTSPVANVALTPIPTTVSLDATATNVLAGTSVTLSGTLSGKTPLAGVPVTIQRQLPGSSSWTSVRSTTTSSTGTFALPTTMMTSAAYRASYAGTPAYTPTTSTTQAITVTRAATTASMGVSNTKPYKGWSITIGGTLSNNGHPVVRRRVTVVGEAAGTSTWTTVGAATTDSAGHYAVTTAAQTAGTYRADFTGDAYFLPTSSQTQSITITPPMATRLTLHAPSTHLKRGRSMALSGQLTTRAGAPVGRHWLGLWKRRLGRSNWYRVGRVMTGPDGTWKATVAPRTTAFYRVQWYGGTVYLGSASPVARINVS
jgi:GH25 family lysozyme M1 (1,4-beta-N-acetylmuramidase)/5-hydroxyisourate hydrolase-like protein (transthyretin family)